MNERVRVRATERDRILAELKSTLAHEDLRFIVYELQRHLSPEIAREEAAPPYPRPAPPGLAG